MKKSEWISVKDGLPGTGGDNVLVTNGSDIEIAFWFNYFELNVWSFSNELARYGFGLVTHWMPLPEPPEE